MRLIAIDPSSTTTGWAVFHDGSLLAFGAVKRHKDAADPWIGSLEMAGQLVRPLKDYLPDKAIIEIPRVVGKMPGSSVTTYAAAVGMVYATACHHVGMLGVSIVSPAEWMRHTTRDKKARQRQVAAQFGRYDPATDRGMDVSDAIAIGQWFIAEQAVRG